MPPAPHVRPIERSRQAPCPQAVGGIVNREVVVEAPGQGHVALGLRPFPHFLPAARRMAVIVVLVNRRNRCGRIDHGHMPRAGRIDQPIIPHGPAHSEGWHLAIQPAAEDEVVDASRLVQHRPLAHRAPQVCLPSAIGKVDRVFEVQVPSPPDHQQLCQPTCRVLDRGQEVGQQDDIGIDIRYEIIGGVLLGGGKYGIDSRCPGGGRLHSRDVPRPDGTCRLGRTGVIPENEDLDLRPPRTPRSERVALDARKRPSECLGDREQCNHDTQRPTAQ